MIPVPFTYDGKDLSPPLAWTEPPMDTKSFALINDDPDSNPLWAHWLIYNIPGTVRSLPENLPKTPTLLDGTLQGTTNFGKVGYWGPCPPSGVHHYYFRLYALDTVLRLPAKARQNELEIAIKDHILAQSELMGTYTRKGR